MSSNSKSSDTHPSENSKGSENSARPTPNSKESSTIPPASHSPNTGGNGHGSNSTAPSSDDQSRKEPADQMKEAKKESESGAKRKRAGDDDEEAPPKKKAQAKPAQSEPKFFLVSSQERDPAVVCQRDRTKFKIVLTKKKDRSQKTYLYSLKRLNKFNKKKFDWADADCVKDVNNWRQQIFRRAFGKKRPARKQWTRVEERVLVKTVKKQALKAGSGKRVDWDAATKEFNEKMAAKKLKKGQKYAVTKTSARASKNPQDSKMKSNSASISKTTKKDGTTKTRKPQTDKVKESGAYLPRSKSAVKNQAQKFASLDAVLALNIPEDWELDEEELNKSSEDEGEEDTDEDDSESDDELEGDSDDEQDGKRPASNALEGTLVSAS